MAAFTYKDLDVWKQGMDLVEMCYRVTESFPRREDYGLTSQIRRAAVSIPSNIAEGHCRRTIRAYMNHVNIALGSHAEMETCIELARRLGFLTAVDEKQLRSACDSVGRLLSGLRIALEHRLQAQRQRP
jgi:four helix bundle protein